VKDLLMRAPSEFASHISSVRYYGKLVCIRVRVRLKHYDIQLSNCSAFGNITVQWLNFLLESTIIPDGNNKCPELLHNIIEHCS